jgi:hypothetical protein
MDFHSISNGDLDEHPNEPLLINGHSSHFFRGWNEIKVSGKLPERRCNHTLEYHDGFIYICGGQDLKMSYG